MVNPNKNIDEANIFVQLLHTQVEGLSSGRMGAKKIDLTELLDLSGELRQIVQKFQKIIENKTPLDARDPSEVQNFQSLHGKISTLIQNEENKYGLFDKLIQSIIDLFLKITNGRDYKNPLDSIKDLNENFATHLNDYTVKLQANNEERKNAAPDRKAARAAEQKAFMDEQAKAEFGKGGRAEKERTTDIKQAKTFLSKINVDKSAIQSAIDRLRSTPTQNPFLSHILENLNSTAQDGNIKHLYKECRYTSLQDSGQKLLSTLDPSTYKNGNDQYLAAELMAIVKPIVDVVNARIEQAKQKPANDGFRPEFRAEEPRAEEPVGPSQKQRPKPPTIYPFENGDGLDLPSIDTIKQSMAKDQVKGKTDVEEETGKPREGAKLETTEEEQAWKSNDKLNAAYKNLLAACDSNDFRNLLGLDVTKDTTKADIKNAINKFKLEVHPDKNIDAKPYATFIWNTVNPILAQLEEKMTERA